MFGCAGQFSACSVQFCIDNSVGKGDTVSGISDNMRTRREALKISRATLARVLGTNETQIKRYETTTSPPSDLLVNIAAALNFPVTQLLGIAPIGLDLSGRHHAVWQTTRRGAPTINTHEMTAVHAGEFLELNADQDDDYAWNASLQMYGTSMSGTYRAVDINRAEHGSLYFVLSHMGDAAIGRWQGQYQDGILGSGYGVLARDAVQAELLLNWLIKQNGPITEFPTEV